MSTAFIRWAAVGMVFAGVTGCLGGGSGRSTDGEGPDPRPARASDRRADDAPAKGSPDRRADDAPAKGASPAKAGSPAKGGDPGKDDRPGPAADAGKLRIVEGKGWLDSDLGFVKIAGEVKNETGQWITGVRVSLRLYDAAGKELGTDSIATAVAEDLHQEPVEFVYAERTFVPPGETAPFYFLRDVKSIKGTYASHKLSVTARAAEGPPSVALSGLTTEKDAGGRFQVKGKIQNTGGVGCRSPKAVIGLYGADGKILGALSEAPDAMFQKVLGPGQSVDVERGSIDLPGLQIDSVKAWADCEEP